MTCKALARLHRKRVVHGSLTPDNVLWFGGEDLVKLSSFSFWAFDGTNIPLHPALRYAPPEVLPPSLWHTPHEAGAPQKCLGIDCPCKRALGGPAFWFKCLFESLWC